MSEFALDGESGENGQAEHESHSEPQSQFEREPHKSPGGSGHLTLSASDFSALEERILRAVEVVRKERTARGAAEERAARAEEQLREQAPVMEQLEKDLNALRAERDHVRERVERLLGQLDALEL